ncbi:hypothetical protein [Compostimonas suwonensis]|uniref:Hydroxymethylpyrimidine pyrophosphatase-like HAD family hydrolase n=1 Tax=Compostimonas suwonensis TaxID=1048394 RepID=A0A2M9C3F2_9MICO|nr:hypothetical protein [Compostimonas suwonensis]PJJ65065.1 hypothetical protein CLV54_0092 [Compostimonas suwonensis]
MTGVADAATAGTSPDTVPLLGLLLDVDGPIASPVTRSINIPSITGDLVTLAAAGIPVVFNTGRSDEFLIREVVAPLVAAGLPTGARVFAVCEKGAVWFAITPEGAGEIRLDEGLAVPADYGRAIEGLVGERYSQYVFYDHTKRAMVSVEQRKDVAAPVYHAMRDSFDADAFAELQRFGLGARWNETEAPDANGRIDIRIDPTIISTDIESVRLGKDLGAQRAIEMLEPGGPLPRSWRTVGDSRSDYAMADWLHEHGHDVAHVDVRPADGVPSKPYPVLTAGELIHDDAGAAFLRRWVAMVAGEARDDEGVGSN